VANVGRKKDAIIEMEALFDLFLVSINQRTGEKKRKYCGNFELTCQCIYMDTAEATEICSAIDARSANINIMLFFVKILVCALIDIGKS